METLYSLFEKAEQVEHVMADIYLLLADGTTEPEAENFLRQLHEEELQHAARIRLFASAYTKDRSNMRNVSAQQGDLLAAARRHE